MGYKAPHWKNPLIFFFFWYLPLAEVDDEENRRLYAGFIDRQKIEDGFPYDMETVRQPRERIQRYEEGNDGGPDDIALIRTKQPITFIQDKVSPVREVSKVTIHNLSL